MNSTRLPNRLLSWLLAASLPMALSSAFAQTPVTILKQLAETPSSENASAAEKPDAARARLEQWQHEARDQLTRFDAATPPALPEGITAEDLEDRRRDLEQTVLVTTRLLKNFNAVQEAQKTLEASRAETTAWSAFKEKPPYSLLMVDDLLNERDATKAKLSAYESSLANYERLLAATMVELKSAEETVSGMILTVQNATATESAKWRLEAARSKSRPLAVRANLMQTLCESLKTRIEASKTELSLIERKIKIASTSCHFSDEDLTKVSKLAEARKQTQQKEIAAIAKRLKLALTARSQAQSAVDALTPAPAATPPDKAPQANGLTTMPPPATPTAKEADAINLAKFRLEVAEGRVEILQFLIEALEGQGQLENLNITAYKNRRAILDATSPEAKGKAVAALSGLLDQLRAWENVLDNDLSGSNADLSKLEARAGAIPAEDPRFTLFNEQRANKVEKHAMLQRLYQEVMTQRQLLKRWYREYDPDAANAGISSRLSALAVTGWETLQNIWAFELMSFEDKVVVDGRTITGQLPVTLGMLLRALLFFLIGYKIASHIAKRIQASLVTRGHIADAAARTLRTWAMIVVGAFLVIGTLAFLRIPLTVFAFFGGALAIGIGFGTQTLIKNFISGIIVLAERKVRVGDILDVDGIVGTVTEINTRSSVIRSPDDVETMIPNSAFLENRVTNWTLTSAKMRRNLRVGVAYGTPPQQVMELLLESAARHGVICKHPAPFAVFEDFGDSALIFQLYFWLDLRSSTNAMIVTSDLRLMIEKRLAELGIGVPFPQRDLHLVSNTPLQVQWTGEGGGGEKS